MFRVTIGAAVLGASALVVGCAPTDQTTGRTAGAPTTTVVGTVTVGAGGARTTTLAATDDDTTPPPATTTRPAGATTTTRTRTVTDREPKADTLRAEPSAVTLEPGGEARVKLVGRDIKPPVSVMVEPEERKITAMVEKDQVTIRAANDASGQATVKVKTGDAMVSVQVTIKPAAKAKK